eukprot:210045_1
MESQTMQKFIKAICILNIDKKESTLSQEQIISEETNDLNNASFILSDADEELLILIEFKYMMNLKSIKMYALPHDNCLENISAPKQVHVYKLSGLNIDFDDIKHMKPDKSIKCKTNKLAKGQMIDLTKKSIKFKNSKYLAIYIESNQSDTDITYLNSICLTMNVSDNAAHELVVSNASPKNNKIITEVNTNYYISLHCSGKLSGCQHLHKVSKILKLYHLMIQTQQRQNNQDQSIAIYQQQIYDNNQLQIGLQVVIYEIRQWFGDNYNIVDLLNNFNHLLKEHHNEFEDIYNIL